MMNDNHLQHRRALHGDHVQLHACASSRMEFLRSDHRWRIDHCGLSDIRVH